MDGTPQISPRALINLARGPLLGDVEVGERGLVARMEVGN